MKYNKNIIFENICNIYISINEYNIKQNNVHEINYFSHPTLPLNYLFIYLFIIIIVSGSFLMLYKRVYVSAYLNYIILSV